MEHPDITEIRATGYPRGHKEPIEIDIDALGNPIYESDEVFVYEDYSFLYEELSQDAIDILKLLGADKKYIDSDNM